jgi:hypothetical protein
VCSQHPAIVGIELDVPLVRDPDGPRARELELPSDVIAGQRQLRFTGRLGISANERLSTAVPLCRICPPRPLAPSASSRERRSTCRPSEPTSVRLLAARGLGQMLPPELQGLVRWRRCGVCARYSNVPPSANPRTRNLSVTIRCRVAVESPGFRLPSHPSAQHRSSRISLSTASNPAFK